MKRKILKALPVLWLVFGVVFVLGSRYGDFLMKNADSNAKQLTHRIEPKKASQKRIEKKSSKANFDPNSIKPVTPEEYAAAQLAYEKITNQWGIGSIFIPSSNIQTKVLAGMDNQNLMVGVGTYYQDQQLGKGNFVALAHNMGADGGMLKNLHKTELNKVFYATDFTNVYEYVAQKNEIVDQSAGEYLDLPKKDDPALLTLIRCEGGENTIFRAVLQGKFLKSYPADQATNEVKLGLGLIESRTTEIGQNKTGNQEKFSPKAKKKSKKENDPDKSHYSIFQRFCILSYMLLNTAPVATACLYAAMLIIFVPVSNSTQNIFRKR